MRAHANGRYPTALQLAFDPADANHFALITTFGLLESRDGGTSVNWICEPVLGLMGTIDPVVTITQRGVTVVTSNTGIVSSSDGCSFLPGAELTSMLPPDLTLSRSVPGELFAFTTGVVSGDRFDSRVMHSVDDGRTWAETAVLPDDLLPLTIDVAPSDASRVYVTGRLGSNDAYASVMLRSDDAGRTFERTATVPGSEGLKYAYISAVHPSDADLVYLRVADLDGTIVLKSDDGGASFQTLFNGNGQVLGFALSEDELALGGPLDGVWVADAVGAGLERRWDVGANCLAFGADALYVCADSAEAGFSLARVRTSDGSIEPLFTFASLCGSSSCGAETQAGEACPRVWSSDVGPRVGSSCEAGTGGAQSGGSGGNGGNGGSSGDDGGHGPRQREARSDSGSCGLAPNRPGSSGTLIGVVLGAVAFLRKRRARSNFMCHRG